MTYPSEGERRRPAQPVSVAAGESRARPGLAAAEVRALLRAVEAGVLARAALADGVTVSGATAAELAEIAAEGQRARRTFVEANLGLARLVATQYADRSGESAADLFQEACLGLLAAVERFDYARGLRFSTYAVFWIRAYVAAAAATRLGALNMPASRAGQVRATRAAQARLTQRLGREPRLAEIAEEMGRDEAWTRRILGHQPPVSLEVVGDVDLAHDRAELTLGGADVAETLLGMLDPTARRVIELRVGMEGPRLSTAAVACAVGVAPRRVRELERSALAALRNAYPAVRAAHDGVERRMAG